MKKISILLFLLSFNLTIGQKIDRVEPPFWWSEMKNPTVQLMVYGKNIASYQLSFADKSIEIVGLTKTENQNYLFIVLNLEKAKAGSYELLLKKGKSVIKHTYELKQRAEKSALRKGFDSSDVIYLITPDRFANGNPNNDSVKGMLETKVNRSDDYGRHGGDLRGIINHLDYINEMGFTAIWPTPLLTNDMPESSYHGYAITDLYQVDPRFGTLNHYIELSAKAKQNGIKLIIDLVANHIGSNHWWMKDLPAKNWINYQEEYLNNNIVITNHRRTTNQDAYASIVDKKLMNNGWFVSAMPDLNQQNPLLAKYLIQNSIWWIETLDLGGIRQDTYPYPDKEFMSQWAGAIMNEYPNFSIVGEEWSTNPLLVGYWQRNSMNKDGYKSNLTSTMDFPMQKAIVDALNEEESWGTGFVKMYEGLANDFVYADPYNLMIFPDNHDMSRIYTQLGEDLVKTQMALGYILALPRISQIYYGTEVLLSDVQKPGDHGLIRTDFPGGWQNDIVNGFTGKGLHKNQFEMQQFLKKVLNYRKESSAIHQGKTMHFGPEKNVYVLFRIIDEEVVVVILNKNKEVFKLDLNRFNEVGLKGKKVKNIISDEVLDWENEIVLNQKGILILTTKI